MAIIENKKLNFIYLPMIVIVGILFIDIKKQYNRKFLSMGMVVIDRKDCYWLKTNKSIEAVPPRVLEILVIDKNK